MKPLVIVIAGIDTNVGKTIVSAIFMHLLQGEYWKPIQCGNDLDSDRVRQLIDLQNTIYPSSYTFESPLSPHHAAKIENQEINPLNMTIPLTKKPLVIELSGGVLVPLNQKTLALDVYKNWDVHWILVSKYYLGSINHTLLTLEALKSRNIKVLGIIFNGLENLESKQAILNFSKTPCIETLYHEPEMNKMIIKRYAEKWKKTVLPFLNKAMQKETKIPFGIPLQISLQHKNPLLLLKEKEAIFTQKMV